MANPRVIGYFDQSVVEHEFRAKFNNCYVLLQHPKIPLEYWCIETEDNSGQTVYFYSASGKSFSIKNGTIKSELEIVVKFPEEGWYIDPKQRCVYLITRVPAKQWRRAPNRDNMKILVAPISPYIDRNLSKVHVSQGILNLTLNPVDTLDNVQIIGRKYLLAPFNNTWKALYYLNVCIGMYNNYKQEIFMFNSWHRLPAYLFKNVRYGRTFNLK